MLAAALEKPVGRDKDGIVRVDISPALVRQPRKGRIDLAARASVEDRGLQPDGAGSLPYAAQCFVCTRTIGRIDENSHARGLGRQRTQESQPLCCQLQSEIMNAGGVATRSGEARDKTSLDRVYANAEDDRDRRCLGFGRGRNEGIVRRGDDGYATADEISHQRRQPIELAVQPVVLDCYIPVLDGAIFAQALAERSHSAL